jgi:4-hydroxy-tetrahydrodipicolinate synthase
MDPSTRRDFLGVVGAGALAAAASNAAENGGVRSGGKLYVAAVTPCDAKGKYDEALYRDLMPFFKQGNADGVLALGSTGEFPSFSVAERKKIAETALKHRSGLRVLVQVGTPNLPETLDLLAHAGSNGADGVLCIPPFYFKNPSLEGLVTYYSAVLEATKLPVYLYHYPAMSAVPISIELLHKLEHYPNLAGIKDSTGNAESYTAYTKEFPKLDIMTGTENNLPIAMAAGMGAISVTANLFPKQVAAVFQAAREGKDVKAAYDKMQEASRSIRVQGVPGGAPQIKYAFTGHGFRESWVRPPFVNLTDAQKELLKPKLAQLKQYA